MALADHSGTSLEDLVARTWSLPLTVGRSPRGLGVGATSTYFFDSQRPDDTREGAVLLAVGIDIRSSKAEKATYAAGVAKATAVVFKSDVPISDELAAAADRSGVAVLTIEPGLAWEAAYSMIHTALLASELVVPEFQNDDLTGLANALAFVAGGPVVIDDPYMRVLAYSVAEEPVDRVRQESILGRSLSPSLRKMMEKDGILKRLWVPGEVVQWQGIPDDGSAAPRLGIAIRSGDEVLGVIWIAQGRRKFDDAIEVALRETARAAVLPLLNQQVGHRAAHQLRKNLLLSVLDGQASREIVVDNLGFADHGFLVVFAVTAAGNDPAQAFLSTERVQRLLKLRIATLHAGPLEVTFHGQTLFGLMQFEASPEDGQLERILGRSLYEVEKAGPVTLRAGVGSIVSSLSAVRTSKEQAKEALRVLDHDNANRYVTTYSGVRSQIFLASLTRMLQETPELRLDGLNVLFESDQKHGTQYINTLRNYLDSFGDVSAAARTLHIHPNTLRYRLGRVRELSGIKINDPVERFVTELHLRCELYRSFNEPVVEPYS